MGNIVWKSHQKIFCGNFFTASWVKSPKFQNFTGFSRTKFLVSVTFEKQKNFFYSSRTNWGIDMKLWSREQNFLRNILKLKQKPFVSSAHGKISHLKVSQTLETNCHIFGILKDSLVSQVRNMPWPWNFPVCVSPWQKKLIGDVFLNLADIRTKSVSSQ